MTAIQTFAFATLEDALVNLVSIGEKVEDGLFVFGDLVAVWPASLRGFPRSD